MYDEEGVENLAVYYGKVTNRQKEDELCEEYLKFDREFVKRMNENPKNKDKLKPCHCGLATNHQSFHGSLRFCKFFTNIPKIEERKQLIRTKRVCSRCLKTNHSANSCRAKAPACYYCRQSNKPSNHSPALCLGHNNVSFKALVNKMEKEKKEKKQSEENRDVSSFMTMQEEEEQDEDEGEEFDTEEQFSTIVNNFYIGPSKEDIEKEIMEALEGGMECESSSSFTYKTSTGKEVLQSVGAALIGEGKVDSQSLSDEGSQGSFITHKMARRTNCRKLRVTNMNVNTLSGEHTERTFVYLVKVWNFIKENFSFMECVGIHSIGRTRLMSHKMRLTLKKILGPYNMDLQDITNPK